MKIEESLNYRTDRKLILHLLQENKDSIDELNRKFDEIIEKQFAQEKNLALMETRSSIYGTMGGVLGMILVFGFEWMKNVLAR